MKIKIPFSKFENGRETHSNVSDVLDGEDTNQVEQLEDEFRMIPTPKADWADYSAQPQVNENPSIEELESLLNQHAQADEIFMPLSNWPVANIAQIATHLHLIIHLYLLISIGLLWIHSFSSTEIWSARWRTRYGWTIACLG